MGASLGKGGGTTYQTAQITPEQQEQIAATTQLFKNTIAPTYQNAITGATALYNQEAPGVTQAAQNLAGTAQQAQNVLGTTGQSAVQTGIQGLENVFGSDYEQQQLANALAPAQAQYAQNLQNQAAQFGGTGQLGSARQALAQAQTAGMTQAAQEQAAAQVENQIAQQRLAAGQALTGAGQAGLGQAIGAAGQGVAASQIPMNQFAQLASIYYGLPGGSYTPNFSGTQGSTTNTSTSNFGIKI
jgi:hypothetical protein